MLTGNTRDYFFESILPKNGICAEIGVRTGNNAERILKLSNPQKLYLIDCWNWHLNIRELQPEMNDILRQYYENVNQEDWYKIVQNKFKDNKNIEIIKDLSVNVSKQFEDNYFDWVYIDASHDYDSVKEDIEAWWPKIKNNGFLCGHDYREVYSICVKRAVNEFIEKYNLELYYKNIKEEAGVDGGSDWAIKKYMDLHLEL